MKRDLDLVRLILLRIEDSPKPWVDGYLEIDGYESGVVNHHIALLKDVGYLHALELSDANTEFGYLLQDPELLWAGHEFLDQIRDPEIWSKTKTGAKRIGNWSFSLLGELAVAFAKQKANELGLPIS